MRTSLSRWTETDSKWWVLGDVGVGVAAAFTFGKLPGSDGWGTYTVRGISIVASASYN